MSSNLSNSRFCAHYLPAVSWTETLLDHDAEEVVLQLLETCVIMLETGEIPKTCSEARIIVFAKPGKDPSQVKSYWLISLLNHDAKVFASIMARQLNKIITTYLLE